MLDDMAARSLNSIRNNLLIKGATLDKNSAGLKHPRDLLGLKEEIIRELSRKKALAMARFIAVKSERLQSLSAQKRMHRALIQRLEHMHGVLNQLGQLLHTYKALESQALARGYAKIVSAQGKIITNIDSLKKASLFTLFFADGSVQASVLDAPSPPPSAAKKATKKTAKKAQGPAQKSPEQGTLL